MIKSLEIYNFQSHEESTLQLDPGVNIIVGKTDSGKTAILRALQWVINNKPLGDDFRSDWGGGTEVTITTDKGNTITRWKDEGVNIYDLDDSEFVAFKNDVPEEIKQTLNINHINLQKQFDSPFLLTDTSGEVASHFNKLAHISQIDTSLKKVKSAIRAIDMTIKGEERQLEKSENELKNYAFLDKFEIELEVLEEMAKRFISIKNRRSKLSSLCVDLYNVSMKAQQIEPLTEMEEDVENIVNLYENLDNEKARLERMKLVLFEAASVVKKITEKQVTIQTEAEVLGILELYTQMDLLLLRSEELRRKINLIGIITQRIKAQTVDIEHDEKIFENEMPVICPLCGNETKHKHTK